MRRFVPLVALVLLLAVALTGCRVPWRKSAPEDGVGAGKITLVLYFGDKNGEELLRETREVPRDQTTVGLTNEQLAIRELIKGPTNPSMVKTVPPETRLLGIRIENGIAYVNFSQEIRTKHWGGSTGELMTVASIIDTLTENPEIKKVQFLLEGKVEESIWGHGITSEPLPRNEAIIGK